MSTTVKESREKLKPGWKRDADGSAVSPADWHARYVVRAVVIPIASPEEIGKGSPEAWKELREQLKTAWTCSTEAANWALRRLLQNDVIHQPGETKCPKMPKIYLYGERVWTGWSQSAAAVLRTIESNYRSKRYQIVWTGGSSLPNVRYPYPYPVPNTKWSLDENPDGGLFFECRLPDGRIRVRLKGGPEFRPQLVRARWLIENPHLRGEAAIYPRGKQFIVKIVGYFPREVGRDSAGVMFVNTTADSFLVGKNARDDQLWIINGDRAKRWMTRTAKASQRWREDLKYEKRKTRRSHRKTLEDMEVSTLKNRNRLASFIDESAAQAVNHAKRRRLAKIVFNDSCRTFFNDFQWYRLATQLRQKCEGAGIEFEMVNETEESSKKGDVNSFAEISGSDE